MEEEEQNNIESKWSLIAHQFDGKSSSIAPFDLFPVLSNYSSHGPLTFSLCHFGSFASQPPKVFVAAASRLMNLYLQFHKVCLLLVLLVLHEKKHKFVSCTS